MPGNFSFYEYQQSAMRTAGGFVTRQDHLSLAGLGLAGECGEFIELVKKDLFHDKPLDLEKAKKELGDILWYLTLSCDALGISLADVAKLNLVKLAARYPTGFNTIDAKVQRDLNA